MCRQLALLVSGDAAALLLFAGIGRRNHSEGLQLVGVVSTALPFLIGITVKHQTKPIPAQLAPGMQHTVSSLPHASNMCKRRADSQTTVLLLSLAQALSVPCEHKEEFPLFVWAAGWYIAAALTGAYKVPSQRERTLGRAISTAARAWLLAVPVSLSTSCTTDRQEQVNAD